MPHSIYRPHWREKSISWTKEDFNEPVSFAKVAWLARCAPTDGHVPPAARTPPTNSVALTGVKTTGHPLGRQMEVEEREAASGNPQAPFEVSVPGVNRERVCVYVWVTFHLSSSSSSPSMVCHSGTFLKKMKNRARRHPRRCPPGTFLYRASASPCPLPLFRSVRPSPTVRAAKGSGVRAFSAFFQVSSDERDCG